SRAAIRAGFRRAPPPGERDAVRRAPARRARADLVLVAGDPLQDITATRAIERVWKAGRPVDREAYRQRVADALAAAEARAAAPAALAGGRALVGGFDDGGLGTVFGTRCVETTDALMGGKSTARLEVVEGGAAGTA